MLSRSALKNSYKVRGQSSIVRSQDVTQDTNALLFHNQVIEIETNETYPYLLERLKSIEYDFGREQGNKQHVPLDLDILTYNEDVFTYNEKRIPHPNLIRYHYIILPLAEISPYFRHPATGKSIQEIISQIKGDQPDLVKVKR